MEYVCSGFVEVGKEIECCVFVCVRFGGVSVDFFVDCCFLKFMVIVNMFFCDFLMVFLLIIIIR